MAIEEDYKQAYDAIYLKSDWDPFRAPVFRSVLEHLSVYKTPPGHLLDIGCGAGEFPVLCQNAGWTCSGIELSEQAAVVAAQKGVTILPSKCLDGASISREEREQFDAITLINVLDSVCDPIGVLRQVRQMLVPGGVVVIRLPNASFHLFIRRMLGLFKAEDQQAFHLYNFSPSTLESLLRSVGLKTCSIRNSKTGSTPGCSPDKCAEGPVRRFIWRAGGMGLWFFAQAMYWMTAKKVVWASSFELVAATKS